MLVEHTTFTAVQRRLAEALDDPSPDIRAAAARVVFVGGVRTLLPQVATALNREQQEDPAVEAIRVLAGLGSEEHDPAILAALGRLGASAPRTAVTFASLRGEAALKALAIVRAADASANALVPFLAAAGLGVDTLARLAESAVTANDPALFEASIRAATRLERSLPDTLLANGLRSVSNEDVRSAAFYHLLRLWDGIRPLSDGLKESLLQAAGTPSGTDDFEMFVVHELMRRAAGQPPATSPRLLSLLEGPVWAMVRGPAARRLLVPNELSRATRRWPDTRPPDAAAAANGRRVVQTVDRYPNRFLSDLMALSGCAPRQAAKQIGMAVLRLRPDGRAERLSLIQEGLADQACARAARVALVAHVSDRTAPTGGDRFVILPMAQDFIECHESTAADLAVPRLTSMVRAPRKTRDVRPVYPPSAIADRVQGMVLVESVIGPTGCVREARVLEPGDVRLDIASIQAVVGWRFTPVAVDGQRIPVAMNVTLAFSLE